MEKTGSRKKIVIVVILCIVMCALLAGMFAMRAYRRHVAAWQVQQRNQKGILLAFDDYNPNSWSEHFDLFDKYGVKVTFFVNLKEPDEFCAEAVKRGHEIGFHTVGHAKLTEVSKEEFYEETIAPIENFRSQGYGLTSFAYPYGRYEDWMNEELLQHYETVRGAYHFMGYYKESLKKGFMEAYPLDNTYFESDEQFREKVEELLDVLVGCDDGTVACVYSHAISGGGWCITADRLEILFREAAERNLVFYTFQELQ